MIRDATASDIPAILDMGKRFADEAGVTDWVQWDEASVLKLIEFLIEDDAGILLVGDSGMFGGFVFPHEFNNNVLVFKECFWRSEGFEGVKMLKRAEAWARGRGAAISGMFTPIKMDPEGVGRLYGRLGYRPTERIFMKDL